MSLLRNLFPSRTRPIRRPARPARKARLGIQQLDDRVLPSATAALSNGVLTITADNNGSVAVVTASGNQVQIGTNNGNQFFNGPVSKIVFQGGSGHDAFMNMTPIDCQVIGSAGGDEYDGGTGRNLLDRNGFSVNWTSTLPGGTSIAYGLGNGKPTAADLSATGAMTASLSADKTRLTIAGPSGIGFQLVGQWRDTAILGPNNQITHTFTPTGTSLTLHTGSILGDIPLPGAGALKMLITTKAEPWIDPAGEFDTMLLGPGNILPLNTTDDLNNHSPFKQLGDSYGIDLNLPAANWGLRLGSDLLATNGLTTAPLNNAVPYFYFASATNLSGSFGGFAFQAGAPTISAAFDPSDPFVYASYLDASKGLAVGASVNGRIPFTPQLPPPSSVLGVPVPPPNVSGNVYLGGLIPLGDTPLAILGNVVVGLAHDVNGNLAAGAALPRQHGDAVLNLKESLLTMTKSMISQPTIGVTGELDVGKDFLGGVGGVVMKLGNAVAYYTPTMTNPNPNGLTPDQVARLKSYFSFLGNDPDAIFNFNSPMPAFASGRAFVVYAASANPFADIPVIGDTVSKIMPPAQFTLGGVVDSQKNWAVDVSAKTSSLLGFSTSSLDFQASSLTQNLHVQGQIQTVFGLAHLTLQGDISLQDGAFRVTESTGFRFDIIGLATVTGSESLALAYTGGSHGTASINLDIGASASAFIGSVGFSAHAALAVDLNHHVSISGSAGGELDVDGTEVAGVSLDNSGVAVTYVGITSTFHWPSSSVGATPGGSVGLKIAPRWGSYMTSDGPALVGSPTTVRFFVPPGVNDPQHFSAALAPDGLAENYAAAGTDPTASFTFTSPGTYTVYGRMFASDGTFSDYTTTVTAYAPDQADSYFVDRLYHDLLGRSAGPDELASSADALAGGTSRAEVAAEFLASPEYRAGVVQKAYHALLGRYAGSAELQSAVSFLGSGGTAEQLRVMITASPEFAAAHGGDAGFVQGLYQDALGRAASAAEESALAGALAGGASRADLVAEVYANLEHRATLTQGLYREFLRRDADTAGLGAVAQALGQGTTDGEALGMILASGEYAPHA